MFFSESEGTDINFSESEGTDINKSESEGTDLEFNNPTRNKNYGSLFVLMYTCLIIFSQTSIANTAFLYEGENNVYQGLIIDTDGNTQQIEGIIKKNEFEGFIYKKFAVNEKTAGQSDDQYNLYSVDDGTGNNSNNSVDDGTGNNDNNSVDDGTGNNNNNSVDDGTGNNSTDSASGELIAINMTCNNMSKYKAQIQTDYADEYLVINSMHINGKLISCNQK